MASHNELIHLNMHESGGDPADDWSHWQRDTICDIYKCLKWSVESQNHAFAPKHNIKSKMQSNISDRNKSWLLYNGMYRMTSSNGNIFRVTGPLCGEFTGYLTGEFPAQRPVTRIFDVFFDLRLNIRLSKQLWGCWFGTPSRPLWRHCNVSSWGFSKQNVGHFAKHLVSTWHDTLCCFI